MNHLLPLEADAIASGPGDTGRSRKDAGKEHGPLLPVPLLAEAILGLLAKQKCGL